MIARLPTLKNRNTDLLSVTPVVSFPFLGVIISGGHTLVVICRGIADYTLVAGTVDDSIGEAFDKFSVMCKLKEYGSSGKGNSNQVAGGVLVERMADRYNKRMFQEGQGKVLEGEQDNVKISKYITTRVRKHLIQSEHETVSKYTNTTTNNNHNHHRSHSSKYAIKTPLMDKPNNLNYSYSGIKNGFRRLIQQELREHSDRLSHDGTGAGLLPLSHDGTGAGLLPLEITEQLCALFQEVAADHIRDKLYHALNTPTVLRESLQGIVVVGGVASNQLLRR